MNRETIIQMAREAGITFAPMVIDGVEYDYRHVAFNDNIGGDEAGCIERFYALAVAAEREDCAKWYAEKGWLLDEEDVPAAIRARGEST